MAFLRVLAEDHVLVFLPFAAESCLLEGQLSPLFLLISYCCVKVALPIIALVIGFHHLSTYFCEFLIQELPECLEYNLSVLETTCERGCASVSLFLICPPL